MEVKRKRSKGGLFQLFDWNGKSRKKLFSSNSELGSKQGKENLTSLPGQHHFLESDNGVSSSYRISSEYNYASSVTSDEGYGTRPPGVVARLMGLDSLPTSNVPEPYSTPFSDYHSLPASPRERCAPNMGNEYPKDYINVPGKLQGFSCNAVESRFHKVQNRPIERFQTEMLPPRSAKSIPITHHKLLSPIKGPGFIPTKNAAYIMEAAAKIIEASPQAATKSKVSSIGSSSVPLRIRDLKEKMEAAQKVPRIQRQKEPTAVRPTKGHPGDKSQSGSEYATPIRGSINSETINSDSSKNKGKSVSLAVQAKLNVRRREGSTSNSNRSLMNQKEQNEVKSNQSLNSQSSTHKSAQKRTSTNRNNNVLRQNNQKQNCASNKDRLTSKASGSSQQRKKAMSMNGSIGSNRTVNKVFINSETGSRKTESVAIGTEKELSLSKTKNLPRKKGSISGDDQVEDCVAEHAFVSKDKKSIKCNVTLDGCKNWDADSREKGMDVVTFTFTSPLIRSMHEPQSSDLVMGKNNSFGIDSFGESNQSSYSNYSTSSPRLNVIGSDAISLLLDQKLRELTQRVEYSHNKSGTFSSSASSTQDSGTIINVIGSKFSVHEERCQLSLRGDQSDSVYGCDRSSIDDPSVSVYKKWQGSEECSTSTNYSESGNELACQYPSSISTFESSSASGSGSEKRNNGKGSKSYLLVQAPEVSSSLSTNQSLTVDGDTELSDSASSISTRDVGRKLMTFSSTYAKGSDNWELGYLKNILNTELMLKDFLLGQTDNVIMPKLFDQLENQESEMDRNVEGHSKPMRKAFFDCVTESLNLRCQQLVVGSRKAGDMLGSFVNRKGWLAAQIHKEISGLKSMGDLMVDELVDKDMSSPYGRWLDFDIEAFEEGVEIEKLILSSLVDELVADLFLF